MRVNLDDTGDDYDGGVANGPYAEWFWPGRPYKQGTINFGLLIGVNRKWHPNGQLAMETEYDDKGRQLYRREWDANGVLTYEYVA